MTGGCKNMNMSKLSEMMKDNIDQFNHNYILVYKYVFHFKVAVNVSSSGKACFEIYLLC